MSNTNETSLDELLAARKKMEDESRALEDQIKAAKVAQRQSGLDRIVEMTKEIMAVANTFEVGAKELSLLVNGVLKPGKAPKAEGSALYKDPVSGGTWAGRGKHPSWLKAALAAGATLESFLVKSDASVATTDQTAQSVQGGEQTEAQGEATPA